MPSAADRIDFGPPRDAGALRSFGLALLAHGLLIAALTWGLNWKRSDQSVAFEAELWSSVPQQAAPKLVEPVPEPAVTPPPPPAPAPEPPRPPELRTPALAEPSVDIALEQEKKRRLLKQQKETEAKKAADKQKADAVAKAEKEQKAKQALAEKRKADEAKKLEAKKQQAKEQATTAATEKQRKENLARMMSGAAGASGAEDAKGSALKSSGPSASYGGKVRAKVRPNIVFTEEISGNPSAEVEVRSAPDGTIMSQRLIKSSGNKAWDDAVIKAIVRTESMPRDADGRVPTPMIIEFRPRD